MDRTALVLHVFSSHGEPSGQGHSAGLVVANRQEMQAKQEALLAPGSFSGPASLKNTSLTDGFWTPCSMQRVLTHLLPLNHTQASVASTLHTRKSTQMPIP